MTFPGLENQSNSLTFPGFPWARGNPVDPSSSQSAASRPEPWSESQRHTHTVRHADRKRDVPLAQLFSLQQEVKAQGERSQSLVRFSFHHSRCVCGSTPGSDPCRSVRKRWGWPTVLEAAKWMTITSLNSLRCRVRQHYSVLLMVVIKVSSLSWGAESKREKKSE